MSSTPLQPMFVDSLVWPDFVTLQVSHDRLELLDEAHCVEAGSDAAQSAKARNSIEKMLCHELAGTRRAINENDSQVNVGLEPTTHILSPLYIEGHERLNTERARTELVRHRQALTARCMAAWLVSSDREMDAIIKS